MVSAADIQTLIILEVGDADSGVLAANMPLIWASYADKAAVAPRLQELYSKRRAIDVVVGATRKNVDFTTTSALSVKQSQELVRLAAMRAETQDEIARLERKARSGRGAAVALITATAPESPPTTFPVPLPVPDGNDPRYRGDPYVTTFGPVR